MGIAESQATDAMEFVTGMAEHSLKNGVISPVMARQLVVHRMGLGEILGSKVHFFDVHSIFDAVAWLEGTGRFDPSKPAEELLGPLKGLWHKHFVSQSISSFAKNMKQELLTSGTFEKLWHTRFQKYRDSLGLNDEDRVPELAGLIAHTFVIDLYRNRHGTLNKRSSKNRMTGEWIVFAKTTSEKNIYLTLAAHGEDNDDILHRVKTLVTTYPDLANLPGLQAAT